MKSSTLARVFKSMAVIEDFELRAVTLSMLYFFFLFGSYSVVKPVRDALGTLYGVKHLQELVTATFLASLAFAPLYSELASRLRLSTFLPWGYRFNPASLLLFFAPFRGVSQP